MRERLAAAVLGAWIAGCGAVPPAAPAAAASDGSAAAPDAAAVAPDATPEAPSQVVAVVPDFPVTDLEGKTLRLAELRGSVVLLNFWGVD